MYTDYEVTQLASIDNQLASTELVMNDLALVVADDW